MATSIDEMTDHIAQMKSWLFNSDMADALPGDIGYANAERARKSAQIYALASIAESLARIASTVRVGSIPGLGDVAYLASSSPWE